MKLWLESISGKNGARTYGMSSAAGCTIGDLPTNVPAGSVAVDYSLGDVYFFDGTNWNLM